MANPTTAVSIPGPDGPETWAASHKGKFRIAEIGEWKGHISLSCKISSSAPCWVLVLAHFYRWDEATQEMEQSSQPATAYSAPIGDEVGEFGYVSTVALHMRVPPLIVDGKPVFNPFTHWQPRLYFLLNDPKAVPGVEGVPAGTKIRIDDIYVPDNGYPVASRPYLDGDQPGGIWEGPPHASTSIYGTKPVDSLKGLVAMEEEFIVPSDLDPLDPALLIHLEDDLPI